MVKGVLMDFGGTIDSDGIHWFNAFESAYSTVLSIPQSLLRDAYVHAERTLGQNHIIEPYHTFKETLKTKITLHSEYLAVHGVYIDKKAQDSVLDCCYNRVSRHIETLSKPVIMQVSTTFPILLVTNFYGNMHTVLKEFGLDNLFLDVVESSVVGLRKPDPALFKMGAMRLGLNSCETVMVGDSISKDIVPAQEVGCSTIWLRGLGWSGSDETDCIPLANATISSLAELPRILSLLE